MSFWIMKEGKEEDKRVSFQCDFDIMRHWKKISQKVDLN
jgi:hypothetical protein